MFGFGTSSASAVAEAVAKETAAAHRKALDEAIARTEQHWSHRLEEEKRQMRHEQLISVRMALAEDDANSATLVASLRCVEAELDWLKGITSHQAQRILEERGGCAELAQMAVQTEQRRRQSAKALAEAEHERQRQPEVVRLALEEARQRWDQAHAIDTKKVFERLSEAHRVEIDELHTEKLELQNALEARIEGLTDEVKTLRATHSSQLQSLRATHSSELQSLRTEHTSQLDSLRAKLEHEHRGCLIETSKKAVDDTFAEAEAKAVAVAAKVKMELESIKSSYEMKLASAQDRAQTPKTLIESMTHIHIESSTHIHIEHYTYT